MLSDAGSERFRSEVLASKAWSPLGRGEGACPAPRPGRAPDTVPFSHPELTELGLAHPLAALRHGHTQAGPGPCLPLLMGVLSELAHDLDQSLPHWRTLRLAMVLGTSAGAMFEGERFWEKLERKEPASKEEALECFYQAPLELASSALNLTTAFRVTLLGACASSTLAIGVAHQLLEAGAFDLVIAGGFDSYSRTVAAGFESLGAISSGPPRPFASHKTGFVVGEGAAVLALTRPGTGKAMFSIEGFGASSDAYSLTAPEPSGRGLVSAARDALGAAGLPPEAIGLVSAHATGTRANDEAETRALQAVWGQALPKVAVHAAKAQLGHTLGASGALEMLIAAKALEKQCFPATLGDLELEAERYGRALSRGEPGAFEHALKWSAGFGGVNAALVLGKPVPTPKELGLTAISERQATPRPTPRESERTWQLGPELVEASLEAVQGLFKANRALLERSDPHAQLVITAVGQLMLELDEQISEHTSIVLATTTACLAHNHRFWRQLRDRGPGEARPRLFPPTSPNAPAALASLAFGLLGPALAVTGQDPLSAALAIAPTLGSSVFIVETEWVDPAVERLLEVAAFPAMKTFARARWSGERACPAPPPLAPSAPECLSRVRRFRL